ncbi:CCE_0567 family metalloprotein [Motiliproteus sediminis]|uniref:CCE_0567 family metalloprotein n=1 Tax=Motiliproteus sediminis TaxID=1468178 RepID=UPI001AEF82E0|nr:CCE_0567 family metalloprotein [Motiliproteus sediminis]
MTELLQLEKEVKKRKRMASEWAMQLHDLAEERLPAGFEELPQLAEATYKACQEWQRAVKALKAAQR